MMKLHYTAASPFCRKALVTAIECGVDDRMEIVVTNPHLSEPDFVSLNPFSKVPTLVLDDSTVLFESLLICEYLDGLAGGGRVLPRQGWARLQILRKHAIGNGIMEACVLRQVESLRAKEPDREKNIARQQAITERALDQIETVVDSFGEDMDLGNISVAVSLGYIDFRFGNDSWRNHRPKLEKWYAKLSTRRSFVETSPAK